MKITISSEQNSAGSFRASPEMKLSGSSQAASMLSKLEAVQRFESSQRDLERSRKQKASAELRMFAPTLWPAFQWIVERSYEWKLERRIMKLSF